MPIKTLICLANSRKPGGRCVAAKELTRASIGSWVRPVSDRALGELNLTERWYGHPSTEVQVGHIFKIALLGSKKHNFQPENLLVDTTDHPNYVTTANFGQLIGCLDRCSGDLFINDKSSTYGHNDCISESIASKAGGSLKLIRVNDLKLKVAKEWPDSPNSKRTVRGLFSLNNTIYKLMVTDPAVEKRYLAGQDGIHIVGDAIMCISLSEPINQKVYKLIASIILEGKGVKP